MESPDSAASVASAFTALFAFCTFTTAVAYASAGAVFVSIMIFTHTFAFGLLSRLDPSGGALAGTPAMLMVGAAIGPILGGTLVKFVGYQAIGIAVVIVARFAITSFSRARMTLVAAQPAE